MVEGDSNHKVEVYGECVRNHAASLGAIATDGCGEFTLDETRPRLLKCDACGCHRNFHRKFKVTVREDRGRVLRGESSNARGKEPIVFEVPEMPDIPEEEMTVVMDHLVEEVVQQDVVQPNMIRAQETKHPERKRPRTKFTDNQKKKMFTFAEEINWKLRRKEQKEIDEFCDEVGVPRNVFMVWMHNHKRRLSSSRTKK